MFAPSTATAETISKLKLTLVLLRCRVNASIGQVDANRQKVRAERADAEAVELRQRTHPLGRGVVGHQVGRAVVPAPVQPDADIWIRLNVLDVLRLLAELRDEPELVTDAAAPRVCASGLARLPSLRLEQGLDG